MFKNNGKLTSVIVLDAVSELLKNDKVAEEQTVLSFPTADDIEFVNRYIKKNLDKYGLKDGMVLIWASDDGWKNESVILPNLFTKQNRR
jgi:hypothetical protein